MSTELPVNFNPDNAVLGVLMNPDKLTIQIDTQSSGYWNSQNPADVFLTFFNQHFPEELLIKSRFNRVVMASVAQPTLVKSVTRPVDGNQIELLLPVVGPAFEFSSGEKCDYVLIIGRISTRESFSSSPSSADLVANQRNVSIDFDYGIWDNAAGKLILYGTGSGEHEVNLRVNRDNWFATPNQFFMQMTQESWRKCLKSIADKAILGTPFAG
ncbi:MAG TPA: hypothetical protein PKV71_21455 [Calditrichia bacterium]|nr:hypothetical protein [Calditrichia bacterium]